MGAMRLAAKRRFVRGLSEPRRLSLLSAVLAFICLTLTLVLGATPARAEVRKGTIGNGCSYTLEDSGKLTIYPTDGVSGEMAPIYKVWYGGNVWSDSDDRLKAVRSVVVERGVSAPEDSFSLFGGLSAVESLDLSGLDTSRVTDMSGMFSGCASLPSLDLSGWDTSRVTDMWGMFYECPSLSSLDLSHFDTSRVTNMGGMFAGCSSLASLDLSGWDTSGAGGMWGMFLGCSSLSSLAVGERCGGVLSADRHTALPAGVGGWGWHSERDERWLTTGELSSSRQGVADTYTAPGAWRSLVSPQAAQASP